MKLLPLIAVTFVTAICYSQSKKFSFQLGSEYELPRRSDDLAFFGNNTDGIINLTLKRDELTILRFDPQYLNQTSDKVIELPGRTKSFTSEALVRLEKNYYWICSDVKDKKEMLYAGKIDVAAGKMAETGITLSETTKLAGNNIITKNGEPKVVNKYKFDYDADRTRMLVSYRLYPERENDKKNYDKIGIQVFDENMHKLWGNEFTMPYTEAIMDNMDYAVDANGNAYLLAKVFESDKRREEDRNTGKAGYHYEVFRFAKDSKDILRTAISVDDFFIKEASLIESSQHELVIACTYSKKAKSEGTDGIFLATMDQQGIYKKYKNGYYEFPLAELEKYESAGKKRRMERKNDYEVPNLVVRNIIVQPDGSVFIGCEEYRVVERVRGGMPGIGVGAMVYSKTYYYYEDIICARISASGNFEWLRKIPKSQKGEAGKGTMSYRLVNDTSGYYFLYLDNKKNMELTDEDVPAMHLDGYGGQVVVSKVSNSGEVSKELLFDTRDEELMIFPSKFYRINGNQFIGRADIKRGGYKPLLITVN